MAALDVARRRIAQGDEENLIGRCAGAAGGESEIDVKQTLFGQRGAGGCAEKPRGV